MWSLEGTGSEGAGDGRATEADATATPTSTGDASVPKDAHTPWPSTDGPRTSNGSQNSHWQPVHLRSFSFHDVSTATKCSLEPIPLARGLPGSPASPPGRMAAIFKDEKGERSFRAVSFPFFWEGLSRTGCVLSVAGWWLGYWRDTGLARFRFWFFEGNDW